MAPRRGGIAAARRAASGAFLLAPLLALAACSAGGGDGDGEPVTGGDGQCGIETAPYLTEPPDINHATGIVGEANDFFVTVQAEGAVGIMQVVVWLFDIAHDPDNDAVSTAAFGNLTQESAGSSAWSSALQDNTGDVFGEIHAGTHYLWVEMLNDEGTFTQYWRDEDESQTRYYCVQFFDRGDASEYAYGLSGLDVVTVEMSNP